MKSKTCATQTKMGISRFEKHLNIDGSSHVIGVYGNLRDEEFISSDLIIADFEPSFARWLREQGFEHVIFFNLQNRLYAYDLTSIESCIGEAVKQEKKTPSSDTQVRNFKDGRPLGLGGKSILKKSAPPKSSRMRPGLSQKGDFYTLSEFGDQVILEALEFAMRTSSPRSAVVIVGLDQLVMEEQTLAKLLGQVSDWRNLPLTNRNRCFLTFSSGEEAEARSLVENSHLRIFADMFRRGAGSNLQGHFRVGLPGPDEVRLITNYVRLTQNKVVTWSEFPHLVDYFYGLGESLKSIHAGLIRMQGLDLSQAEKIFRQSAQDFRGSPNEAFDELVGLEEVKLALQVSLDQMRHAKGNPYLKTLNRPHLAFLGNPGTGKTEVARIFARLLKKEKVMRSGKLLEVRKADLIEPDRARKMCEQALGGILFVDEAHNLMENDQDTQGRRILTLLMTYMEEHRSDLLVILAGQPVGMRRLFEFRPELKSRMDKIVNFPDLDPESMAQLFQARMRLTKRGFSADLLDYTNAIFQVMFENRRPDFGNAREVDAYVKELFTNHDLRVKKLGLSIETEVIGLEDLPESFQQQQESLAKRIHKKNDDLEVHLSELNNMIGLQNVKDFFRRLVDNIEFDRSLIAEGEMKDSDYEIPSLHMVLTGNPGTGKTTVTRLFGSILKELGVLKRGHTTETDRSGLVAGYVGQTALKTQKVLDSALDGVLFIDEAYALVSGGSNDFGQEAIDKVLKYMEDERGRIVVAAAGYPQQMQDFLRSNPGLKDRFTTVLNFPDFTEDEMWQIFELMAGQAKPGYNVHPDLADPVKEYLRHEREENNQYFANARTVRNLFQEILQEHKSRLRELRKLRTVQRDELLTITVDSIPTRILQLPTLSENHIPSIHLQLPEPNETSINLPQDKLTAVGTVIAGSNGEGGTGSGFFISSIGHILTCHHVVGGRRDIFFRIEGHSRLLKAEVLLSDPLRDMALLQVNGVGFNHFDLLRNDSIPNIGEEIGLLGYPLGDKLGDEVSFQRGVISSKRMKNGVKVFQHSADATYGSSGGPLFALNGTNRGKVLGVLVAGIVEEGINGNYNYATDIAEFYHLPGLKIDFLSS